MATLTTLPLDIQYHILSYLLSLRDVAALSKQCKTLHDLCDMEMRHMYHTVKIEARTGSLDIAFHLLMSILRRPALGHYVRHIEVCATSTRRVPYTEQDPERNLESMICFSCAMRMGYDGSRVGSNRERTWMDEVFIPQALAALIVSVSPFLASMAITPMSTHYSSLSQPGVGRPSPSPEVPYPLDHLLRSVNSNPHKHVPYLQNLRNVYIINGGPRTTVLGYPSISSLYLTSLICSFKVLKDLGYSVGGRSSIDGGYPMFNPKTVIRALLYHKDSLENLDLDDNGFSRQLNKREEMGIERAGRNIPVTLREQKGSLRDFRALKRLSIGIGFLFYFAMGVDDTVTSDSESKLCRLIDHLPPNLQYLCIRGYKKGKFPD
ncbi:hypothetical protein BJX99DRAFT_253304 [Aspergillus californicus]